MMASIILLCVILLAFFVAKSELKSYYIEPNNSSQRVSDNTSYVKKRMSTSPNIIFILADDMGWNDVSFHGSDQIPTPNIDALAYNGVILNNHYVQPVCTPTRAALLTGKYPIHTGMQGNPLLATERRGLPLKEKTIAQYLKKLGYATHIVGKWHLGYHQLDYTPLRRGFDSHLGYWNGAISYYDYIMQDLKYSSYSGYDFRRNYTTAWEYQGKYATDVFTEEAENIINNHDTENPMFLYMAHLAVHSGNEGKLLEAPQETINKFSHIPDPNRRTYAAMVSKLDESVGKVVCALQKRQMLSNSIIVFVSDNGAPLNGIFKNWGSNQPFRGGKATLWEAGVRTPALIWSPLIKVQSRVSKHLMHVTDWLPTLFNAAGGKVDNLTKEIDGINMWPTIAQNEESPRKEVVINIDGNYGALVAKTDNGDNSTVATYKIIIGKGEDNDFIKLDKSSLKYPYRTEDILNSPTNVAISNTMNKKVNETHIERLRDEATVVCSTTNNVNACSEKCLFDLDNDPCEQYDLSNTHSAVMAYMEQLYAAQSKTIVPKLQTEFDTAANPALYNYTWSAWEPSIEFHFHNDASSEKSEYEYHNHFL